MNVTVIGGVSVPLLVEYVVARKPRKSQGHKRKRGRRGAAQQRGFYPVLSLLGITDRLSPLARSLIAEHGNLSISSDPSGQQRLGKTRVPMFPGSKSMVIVPFINR